MAGINYVLEVEATLDRVDTGDNSALTGYHDLQVSACRTDFEPRIKINRGSDCSLVLFTYFEVDGFL